LVRAFFYKMQFGLLGL